MSNTNIASLKVLHAPAGISGSVGFRRWLATVSPDCDAAMDASGSLFGSTCAFSAGKARLRVSWGSVCREHGGLRLVCLCILLYSGSAASGRGESPVEASRDLQQANPSPAAKTDAEDWPPPSLPMLLADRLNLA